MSVSVGTGRAHRWAHQHGKPEFVVDASDTKAQEYAASGSTRSASGLALT